jgi:hypothetical protein
VKITRLNKSLAALIILFFFILGAFAVSLAHESPSIGVFHTVDLRPILKRASEQAHPLHSLFQLGTAGILTPPLADVDRRRSMGQRFNAPVEQALAPRLHGPKVSLQILQSILLL